jgi:hypothetical protein
MFHGFPHRVLRRGRDEVVLFRKMVLLRATRDAGTAGNAAGAEAGVSILRQEIYRSRKDRGLRLVAAFKLRSPRLSTASLHHRPLRKISKLASPNSFGNDMSASGLGRAKTFGSAEFWAFEGLSFLGLAMP